MKTTINPNDKKSNFFLYLQFELFPFRKVEPFPHTVRMYITEDDIFRISYLSRLYNEDMALHHRAERMQALNPQYKILINRILAAANAGYLSNSVQDVEQFLTFVRHLHNSHKFYQATKSN